MATQTNPRPRLRLIRPCACEDWPKSVIDELLALPTRDKAIVLSIIRTLHCLNYGSSDALLPAASDGGSRKQPRILGG